MEVHEDDGNFSGRTDREREIEPRETMVARPSKIVTNAVPESSSTIIRKVEY